MTFLADQSHAVDLNNGFVEASYALGYGGEGATSDGTTLWILDVNGNLHSYDISSGGLSPISVTSTALGQRFGLAWDGSGIWTSLGESYVKINPLTGGIIDSFVSAGTTASLGGLTFDGQYLWKSSRPIFNQIDPATGNVTASISGIDLPGREEGLTFDGQFLLAVSGNPAATIWKIDPSTGVLLGDSFPLPLGSYNGIAFDGQSIWAVGFSSSTLYKISFTVDVTIDIKPDGFPNSINPASGQKIPVAILTTDVFDAMQVDALTAEFGPSGATEVHERGHITDIDGDGDIDLLLHFDVQDTGLACGDTEATLLAETYDGQAVQGTDSVNIVGCID
jgi:hypothetical protein